MIFFIDGKQCYKTEQDKGMTHLLADDSDSEEKMQKMKWKKWIKGSNGLSNLQSHAYNQ